MATTLVRLTPYALPNQATPSDIDIVFDVCWILSPSQIQKLVSQYHAALYEVSIKGPPTCPVWDSKSLTIDCTDQPQISPEILKLVSSRVNTNDKGDHLLLPPETEEAMPYV